MVKSSVVSACRGSLQDSWRLQSSYKRDSDEVRAPSERIVYSLREFGTGDDK